MSDPLGRLVGNLAMGLSRRNALKVLIRGAAGGLLAELALDSAPVHAQGPYLPLLLNSLASPTGDVELCRDAPDCLEEDCCVTDAAIDFGWFRTHLLDEILPKWQLSITEQGLFLPHFDRQWRPLEPNYGTLVTQCRLLYNFCQGYALTKVPLYRDAVTRGVQFLRDHFRDRKYGGWYWSCNLDGTVRETRKDGYGHAFVLFGLAHAYQCTGDQSLQDAISHTWEILTTRFRDPYGGFHGKMTEAFKVTEKTKAQNPVMHIFEALLAAGTVGKQAQLLGEARSVGDFVLGELVRVGDRRLPEVYTVQWQELPTNADGSGGRLDIGHAFEWAYLAAYATELGLPARFLAYANSFLTYAMALGFDWKNGGIYSPATDKGEIVNQEKGWWEQCEAIRALVYFYKQQGRTELGGPLQRMLDFVKASMIDAQYGGWYPRVGPGIDPQTLEKGNLWKVDYHVVGMCMEAIRPTQSGVTN